MSGVKVARDHEEREEQLADVRYRQSSVRDRASMERDQIAPAFVVSGTHYLSLGTHFSSWSSLTGRLTCDAWIASSDLAVHQV